MQQSLVKQLIQHATHNPSHEAVASSDFSCSYAELWELVVAQAERFEARGITQQSVVGISASNDIAHLIMTLALSQLGATTCTLPSHDTAQQQKAFIERVGITHITDASDEIDYLVSRNSPTPLPPHNTDSRLLFSTSGTTGEAKLVVFESADLVAQAHRHIPSPQQRFACLATMEHNFAKRHRLYCVAAGATNVFVSGSVAETVDDLVALQANVIHVSAFQARELLEAKGVERLRGVRLKLGGSLVPAALRTQLSQTITSDLHCGYGTTETGAIAFSEPNNSEPNNNDSSESVGQALPGLEVRVVSADRQPLACGERGEIAIKGAGLFRGYLGMAELSSARLADGWFYSGDIGYLDEQQRITLCGRSDDMFVFNSMNIFPQDIESQLRACTGVADAVLLPKHSEVHGDIPVALITANDGSELDLRALKKQMREAAGVRCPRQFLIANEIPRNASGKIDRKAAAKMLIALAEH